MKTFYLSGPMTGLADLNKAAFFEAEERLTTLGYRVANPARMQGPEDASWEWWMRCALTQLLTCQAIVMLPGWENSRGAKLELFIAEQLGIAVYFWLDGRLVSSEDLEWLQADRLNATGSLQASPESTTPR